MGKGKKHVLVGLVYEGPLLPTNPNASTLPSIDSSYVQVQDDMIPNKNVTEVPPKHVVFQVHSWPRVQGTQVVLVQTEVTMV